MATDEKKGGSGMLFGLIFIMIVLVYFQKYAPQIINYLNQFPFFIFFIEITIKYPYLSLFVFSAAVTFISTLLMMHFTDQEHLKGLKKRQKELQKEIKEAQKRKEFTKLEELNKEIIDISISMAKASFNIKQIGITLIPFLLLFLWLKEIFIETIGWGFWHFFLMYIVFALVSSTVYRKLLKMA